MLIWLKKAYFYINFQKVRLVKFSNPSTFTKVLPYFRIFYIIQSLNGKIAPTQKISQMSVSLSDFDINNHECIPTQLFNTAIEGSMYVANSIAELIDSRNKESKPTVLGLATVSTPTQVYV